MRLRPPLYALLCAAALLAACAGPSRYYRASLNAKIAANDQAGALAELEKVKNSEYGEKNAVLYYLDRGLLLHEAGRYEESNRDLADAEDRMDELFTKSVSRRAGTWLLNDNTTKYAGEVFERALANVFRALDYLMLGGTDDALVEARKVTAYLARFSAYMEGRSGFKDSAFAQYLSGLLFEADGDRDDARICFEASAKASDNYRRDYGTPAPRFDAVPYADLARKGLGEIVFLHYNGPSPMKVSKTFQVAWNDAVIAFNSAQDGEPDEDQRVRNALNAGLIGDAITVAYPEYVQDPFLVAGSRIEASSATAETQLVEDISGIARQTLAEKNAAIQTRAIVRAFIKNALARAAAAEVEKKAGAGAGFLARMVASAAAAGTETADTRGWTTLPAQIRLARLAVPPGRQDVTAVFTRADGSVDGTVVFRDVVVEKGKRTFLHYRTAR